MAGHAHLDLGRTQAEKEIEQTAAHILLAVLPVLILFECGALLVQRGQHFVTAQHTRV